ncbi:MAG TPA: hypothetical protein VNR87_03890 [Flavisolibacter sp.]|nr:hypothetical protein [Flavisolibacter sp.]
MESSKKKKEEQQDPQLDKEEKINDPRNYTGETKQDKSTSRKSDWYTEDLDRQLGEQMGGTNETLT